MGKEETARYGTKSWAFSVLDFKTIGCGGYHVLDTVMAWKIQWLSS